MVLLAPIDVTVVQSFTSKPFLCQLTHKYECPCLFQKNNGMRGTKRVKWLHSQYKKILKRLSYESKYNRDDFTVEYVTALTDDVPRYAHDYSILFIIIILVRTRDSSGRVIPDISLLAPDCFHFLKELHSRAGV